MTRILGLFPSAINAAKMGLSFRQWERERRAAGQGARSSDMLKLWRASVELVVKSPEEPFRDIKSVPSGNELAPWVTKGATGIAQTVALVYRDKATGDFKTTYWRTVTSQGITREQAMATATSAYRETAERYNQVLIGALHVGGQILSPGIV